MLSEKRANMIAWIAAIPVGMILIIAGMGKLIFGQGEVEYTTPFLFNVLPYIEISLGAFLIFGVAIKLAAITSALLIIGFAIANIALLVQGAEGCASCFGAGVIVAPALTLTLDGLMAILVAIIFYCLRGRDFNLMPWYLKTSLREKYV